MRIRKGGLNAFDVFLANENIAKLAGSNEGKLNGVGEFGGMYRGNYAY